MFKDIDELESFMVKHGENIVDLMGGEIDRIELKLRVSFLCYCYLVMWLMTHRVTSHFSLSYWLILNFFPFFPIQTKYPEIRHCDLEIL